MVWSGDGDISTMTILLRLDQHQYTGPLYPLISLCCWMDQNMSEIDTQTSQSPLYMAPQCTIYRVVYQNLLGIMGKALLHPIKALSRLQLNDKTGSFI